MRSEPTKTCVVPVVLALSMAWLSSGCGAKEAGPNLPGDAGQDASADAGGLDASGDADADADVDAASDSGNGPGAMLHVSVLRDVTKGDGTHYQLLQLQRGDAPATYAQWYPPQSGTKRPVVVITKPYDGIDWSPEEVDRRWATLGNGFHADVDSPNAGLDPGGINYAVAPPDTTDDGFVFRVHDMGALLLYGRYYAGGDVQNDIDDMTTGLEFLTTTELADRDRIGIWGGSWGGFEAVYGAAYAGDAVRPCVGAALSPLTDFEREIQFVTTDLPSLYTLPASREAAATFFAPYQRRVEATRRAQGGYQGLVAADIAARIEIPFLLIHEDWDTLVSFDQSTRLVTLDPASFQPLWFLHDAPPSPWDQALNGHGPLLTQHANSALTFLMAFLLTHLADSAQPIIALYDDVDIRQVSLLMLDRQREGVDVGFYAERLRDLTDPRVTLRGWTSGEMWPGAEKVAEEVNAVWGTTFDAATIRAALANGLPAAPP